MDQPKAKSRYRGGLNKTANFVCEPCGFFAVYPSEMEKHKGRSWHKRNTGELKLEVFSCPDCPYKNTVRVNFKQHRRRCMYGHENTRAREKALAEHNAALAAAAHEKEEYATVGALVPLMEKRDRPAAVTIAGLLADIKGLNEKYAAAGLDPHKFFAYEDMMRKMGDMPRFTVLLEIRDALLNGLLVAAAAAAAAPLSPESRESCQTPSGT